MNFDEEKIPDMWLKHTYKIYSFLSFVVGLVFLLLTRFHNIFYLGAILGIVWSFWLSRKVEWNDEETNSDYVKIMTPDGDDKKFDSVEEAMERNYRNIGGEDPEDKS